MTVNSHASKDVSSKLFTVHMTLFYIDYDGTDSADIITLANMQSSWICYGGICRQLIIGANEFCVLAVWTFVYISIIFDSYIQQVLVYLFMIIHIYVVKL